MEEVENQRLRMAGSCRYDSGRPGPMTVVLDANAALELALKRPRSIKIREEIVNASKVIAPDLLQYEVTNVMAKYVKGGYLSRDVGSRLAAYIFELIDEYYPAPEFNQESYHESIRPGSLCL